MKSFFLIIFGNQNSGKGKRKGRKSRVPLCNTDVCGRVGKGVMTIYVLYKTILQRLETSGDKQKPLLKEGERRRYLPNLTNVTIESIMSSSQFG